LNFRQDHSRKLAAAASITNCHFATILWSDADLIGHARYRLGQSQFLNNAVITKGLALPATQEVNDPLSGIHGIPVRPPQLAA